MGIEYVPESEGEQPALTFLGGLRWSQGFVLWPFVRLSLRRDSMSFTPALRRVAGSMPIVALRPATVQRAERISRVSICPAPGVRLRFMDASRPLIFWTLTPRRLLNALEKQGVAVDRAAHRAPFWGT
jgi:hypothetical protein